MQITNIDILREELTLPDPEYDNKESTWDYVTIYDQNKNILFRSNGMYMEHIYIFKYEGLTFQSIPKEEIMVTFESLKNYINKK